MERCTAAKTCSRGGQGLAQKAPMVMLAILIFGITYLIIQRIRAWYRLQHIKGPFWAAFSDIWIIRNTGGGRMYLELAEVCDQYGKFHNHGDSSAQERS
jgi:hypothetical protein